MAIDETNDLINIHWRPSGLKSGGALTKYVPGGTEKVEHIFMHNFGAGQKKWWYNCTG